MRHRSLTGSPSLTPVYRGGDGIIGQRERAPTYSVLSLVSESVLRIEFERKIPWVVFCLEFRKFMSGREVRLCDGGFRFRLFLTVKVTGWVPGTTFLCTLGIPSTLTCTPLPEERPRATGNESRDILCVFLDSTRKVGGRYFEILHGDSGSPSGGGSVGRDSGRESYRWTYVSPAKGLLRNIRGGDFY